jgi:3-mercaptopyruvate sulfurtransferase SseA
MSSRVTPRQVVARMVSGASVSFVDARSEQHWKKAERKIVGAVRARLDSLVRDAARVSPSRMLVVYGHDADDAHALHLAEAFRSLGFPEVRILTGGFEAWSDLHFAVQPTRETSN